MTLVSPPETMLVACHVVAEAKTTEELEEEAPTAPEVIGEKKEEETPKRSSRIGVVSDVLDRYRWRN